MLSDLNSSKFIHCYPRTVVNASELGDFFNGQSAGNTVCCKIIEEKIKIKQKMILLNY